MPRRAINTASQPGSTGCRRTASRRRRFTLFLTTELPIRLLTKNPNRLQSRSLARNLTTIRRLATLVPSVCIWEYRLLPVRRCLRCMARRRWSHAQLMTAFEPPSAQNSPAIGGAGAGTEAVDPGSAAFFRLICSFWHLYIPSWWGDYRAC